MRKQYLVVKGHIIPATVAFIAAADYSQACTTLPDYLVRWHDVAEAVAQEYKLPADVTEEFCKNLTYMGGHPMCGHMLVSRMHRYTLCADRPTADRRIGDRMSRIQHRSLVIGAASRKAEEQEEFRVDGREQAALSSARAVAAKLGTRARFSNPNRHYS